MYSLLLISCVATVTLATAKPAPAPGYYTQNYWPSVVTPYGYSTCYGCRGKRSAEPGYLGLGYGIGRVSTGVGLHPTGVVYESRSAQGLGKRSADPGYLGLGYGIGRVSTGVGLHPTGVVYESRSAQGLGKRSADPGYLGLGYGIGRVSTGVGLHPTGVVYESRSAQGLGKRSAEPGYLGRGYGLYSYGIGRVSTGVGLHPTGVVYESRSAQGLGKRSAEPEPGYYTQNYWPSVVTPYGYSTCYGCRGKRSAEPGYLGYEYGPDVRSYGYGLGGVSTGVGLHPTGSVYESRSAQGLSGRYLY